MASPPPIHVVRLRSIHEAREEVWDSILTVEDLFHTHRFLRTVEDAGVEDATFWYLLFFRGSNLVATAALSAFEVSLELLLEGSPPRLIQGVRRWVPNFLRLRMLCCGIPVSLGQSNLAIPDPSDHDPVLEMLAREMAEIGRLENIRYLCVKEFLESRTEIMAALERAGFFKANTIPYVSMPIRWGDFEEYRASLRHNYRRPINLSLKKIGLARPEVETWNPGFVNSHRPRLVLGGEEVCSPERFFDLYLRVMERAPVKLETLNLAFFERLYSNLRGDLEVLALVKDGESLGCALLTSSDETMTFLLVGLDYSVRDEHDVYFNLVYAIIDLAIQRGCKLLHLGQTSYWLKQRVGGVCIPEVFFFKAESRWVHLLLRSLRPLIFPELRPQKPNVYRSPEGQQVEQTSS